MDGVLAGRIIAAVERPHVPLGGTSSAGPDFASRSPTHPGEGSRRNRCDVSPRERA